MDCSSYSVVDHRIFTIDEERLLFKQYKENPNNSLKTYIIEHNVKFAIKCANKFARKFPHVQASDLTGYAILGLYEAFDRYDYTQGVKFTSYAVWWVKATILRCVESNESAVRLPSNQHDQMQKDLKTSKGNNEHALNMLNTMLGGISFDDPISTDGEGSLHDVLFDEKAQESIDNIHVQMDVALLESLMDTVLTDQEIHVLTAFYGYKRPHPLSLQDIASQYGRSKEYVRHIKDIAITKLSKAIQRMEC